MASATVRTTRIATIRHFGAATTLLAGWPIPWVGMNSTANSTAMRMLRL